MRVIRILALVSFAIFCVRLTTPLSGEDKKRGDRGEIELHARDHVAKYLEWFPSDVEAVLVARGPFRVPAQPPSEDAATFEQIFEAFTLSPLLPEIQGVQRNYLSAFSGETVALAIHGAKHFRENKKQQPGARPIASAGHLIVFQNDLGKSGLELWETIKRDGGRTLTIEGNEVAIVHSDEDDSSDPRLYVVFPQPNVLLCANNADFLKEILVQISRKEKTGPLPRLLDEWKQVDPKAQYWGLRHYDKKNAPQDPSSFLQPDKKTG